MITEDYVSFETAKLLKEKGFDESTLWFYVGDGTKYKAHKTLNEDWYRRPTLQMAMKWLREKKGIAIIPVLSSILDNEKFFWNINIVVAKTNERYSQGWIYENQEDAFDTAIRYCLENLIQL